MTNVNTCIKTPAGTVVTPKGRMGYAQYMLHPSEKSKTKAGKPKYQLTLYFPPTSDLQLLKDAANEIVRTDFASFPEHKKKSLKSPFLDAWEKTGDDQFKGWFMLRVSTTTKPAVVDARGQHVSDENEIYSGRWARASLHAFSYGTEQGAESWGVTFGLSNVQLLDHDEPLGGGRTNPENEFVPVEVAAGDSADNLFS